jgi:hypothetical protein
VQDLQPRLVGPSLWELETETGGGFGPPQSRRCVETSWVAPEARQRLLTVAQAFGWQRTEVPPRWQMGAMAQPWSEHVVELG